MTPSYINHNEKRVQKRQQTLNTHTQSMEVSPASALHIEKSLSPRPWALMHSATSDQWANICAAPNAGKSSPSRCLLAAMHAYQYLMPFSQLNLWILVICICSKILVVSQKPLIRPSTATFLRQNSQSSSIMIWKAGRLGDAADRIRYDSIYQVIYLSTIYIYIPTYILVQYTFIYKHEHFKCMGRYRYIYYILVLLLTKKCPSTFGMWFKGMTSLYSITIFTKESPSAPSALRFARHSPEAPQSDAWERATSGNFENHMDITNIRTLWVQVGSD